MPITARYFEIIKILYRADQSIMDAIENPVTVNDSNGKNQNCHNTYFITKGGQYASKNKYIFNIARRKTAWDHTRLHAPYRENEFFPSHAL